MQMGLVSLPLLSSVKMLGSHFLWTWLRNCLGISGLQDIFLRAKGLRDSVLAHGLGFEPWPSNPLLLAWLGLPK